MKVCPACQQTYADDGLNFCLNDGAVLVQKTATPESQPTVYINPQNSTAPNRFPNQTAQPNWGTPAPPVNNQPKKKSKAWLWVLGIFGGLVLLCGGGLAALVALVPDNNNTNTFQNTGWNSGSSNKNPANNNLLTDDLSGWVRPDQGMGITDFQNNEFYMTSKGNGYYFVLLSGNNSFRTENATTKVSVRNTTGAASSSGYGLMIHNNISTALAQDYAFLIDTVNKSYRIAEHQARKETSIAKWTPESAIKTGTQINTLEVRDNNGKMAFYINGKLVTTVEDKDGIRSGVPALYASGSIPIAFSNLQIQR